MIYFELKFGWVGQISDITGIYKNTVPSVASKVLSACAEELGYSVGTVFCLQKGRRNLKGTYASFQKSKTCICILALNAYQALILD